MRPPLTHPITPSHPFRRRLGLTRDDRASLRKREEEGDVKLFLLSFAAFFVCFYTFLF